MLIAAKQKNRLYTQSDKPSISNCLQREESFLHISKFKFAAKRNDDMHSESRQHEVLRPEEKKKQQGKAASRAAIAVHCKPGFWHKDFFGARCAHCLP
jgi:hypothetical protein